jgi:phosphoserine phosphatase RsbU/P
LARPSQKRDSLDKKLLELTALFDICRSLTSSLSLKSILENTLRIPMGQLLIGKGIVLLKNPSSSEYTVEELKGLPRDLLHKSLAIHTPPDHLLTVEKEAGDGWTAFFREFGIQLLLPLVSSRGTIGLMGFGPKINCKAFEEGEIEFLDSLSNIAATAVVNGMMVDEIQSVNRMLDRKVQQLNTLFDISRELNTTLDRKQIASLLAFAVMGELLVQRCAVLVRAAGGGMEILVAKGAAFPVPLDPDLDLILETVFLNDTDRFESCRRAGLALLVPMRIRNEVKGLLAVGAKISGSAYSDAEIDFLKTLGNQAMSVLENARLFKEELEKQRLEEELNLAQKIQQELLPKDIPVLNGFDIAAVNIPSRQVGGDYFDIIPLSESRLGLAVADVSGKGAGAALLMANLQAFLRALVPEGKPIKDLVFRLNNLVYHNTGLDRYITFFYGELDTRNRTFTFCNAGHNPPYWVDSKSAIVELSTGGIVLGMMPDMAYQTETVTLSPGDRIVLYTDGITEAQDPNDAEYGEERLKLFIQLMEPLPSREWMDRLLDSVKKFRGEALQSDDMTLMVIQVGK